MSQITEEAVLAELRDLPTDCMQEVYDFVGFLKTTRTKEPAQGSAEAILPFCGAWKMDPEERARIEREIEEMRLMEEVG